MTARGRGLLVVGLAVAAGTGCNRDPGRMAEAVDVTGTVKIDGKPAGDVIVSFTPLSPGAVPAGATAEPTGAFKVKMVPGKYAYSFEPKPGRADTFKAIPSGYKTPDDTHSVTVAAGQPVEVTVTK